MGLTAVGSSLPASVSDNRFSNLKKQESGSQLPQKNYAIDARLMTEYYSSASMSLEYTSKDGDKVSFSMESVEYSKSIMDVAATGNKDDMKKLVEYIKDNFDQMKKDLLNNFLKNTGSEVPEDTLVSAPVAPVSSANPEEWGADATSQRIIDFAVSFYGIFEGKGDEFLSTIKTAIDEGFKQARDMLGDLPDDVTSLINETYKQTMEKLDAWAVTQEIKPPVEAEMSTV
jgi:hypothetical protein